MSGDEKSDNEKLVAAADGKLDEVKRLLAAGADVDFGDKFGETALMNACRGGHNEIVEYLVQHASAGINVCFPEKSGWTALMFAGYFGHLALVTYVVACGANEKIKNKKGETVFDMKPCMTATKKEVAEAIAEGKRTLGNPASITAKAQVVGDEQMDETSAALLARAQQYTKISATAGASEALVQFRQLYKRTCKDFRQETVPRVEGVIGQMIELTIPIDVLPLSCPGGQANEKLQDSQIFPLFEVLGHGFPNCPFATIDMSWNSIRNSGAKAIAVYLTQTTTLTSLNISGNRCEQLGIEKLAQSLYGQKTLTALNMSNNPVGDVGMSKFAEALQGNTKLQDINIGHTDLGTVALVKIAVVLRNSSSIHTLNIDDPRLYSHEEETTIAIARAIRVNTALKHLSMAKHRMQDHGAMWMAENLQLNSALEDLDLSCNELTATGVAQLVAALARRDVPCSINLDFNMLKCREHDEINEAIEAANNENTPMFVTFSSEENEHRLVAVPRN